MAGETGVPPIAIEGLVCRYGRREAVRGLDLVVNAGETVALVGENGCGKTTSMRALVGSLRPSKGRSSLLGEDSTKLRPSTFERIGFIAESLEPYASMTARQTFDFFATFYPKWDRGLETSLSRDLDLPLDQPIQQLSRGGKVKAAIVSSLAYRPEVILLDEPLAGLDEMAKELVLQALVSSRGAAATLLCSHELDDIEVYADRIVLMSEGLAQWSLSKEDLATSVRAVQFVHAGRKGNPNASWARFSDDGLRARFVETRFDEERTRREVEAVFDGVSDYRADPASLKAAFRAFADLRRKVART